jgi:predicted peptidase
MLRFSSILAVSLLLATACVSNANRDGMTGPAIHGKTLDGGVRYTVAVPAGHSSKEPASLILALHYGGEVSPFFGAGALERIFEPAFRELGGIVVAPDCPGRGWTDPRSLEAIWAVLDDVSSDYLIDSTRTLVTGYSMGGMGTWYLAANHPDRFSVAVVVSGRPPEDLSLEDWRVPLYVIHSRRDEVLPLDPTVTAVEALETRGAEVRLVVLDAPTHYETGRFVPALRASVPWIRAIWNR